MNTFEELIRERLLALKASGISILDVAKKTGTQQSCLSNFVRRKAGLSLLTVNRLYPFLFEAPQPKNPSPEEKEQ